MTQSLPPSDPGGSDPEPYTAEAFSRVRNSSDFALLRGSFRRFAFPMTALFLLWYLVYVLLSTYAVGFMSIRVIGHVNVGLLMGLGQFVTTFVITGLYVRHANRKLDPLAASLRREIEDRVDPEGLA